MQQIQLNVGGPFWDVWNCRFRVSWFIFGRLELLDVWGSAPNAQKDKTSKKDQLEKILKTSNPSENGERCEKNDRRNSGGTLRQKIF